MQIKFGCWEHFHEATMAGEGVCEMPEWCKEPEPNTKPVEHRTIGREWAGISDSVTPISLAAADGFSLVYTAACRLRRTGARSIHATPAFLASVRAYMHSIHDPQPRVPIDVFIVGLYTIAFRDLVSVYTARRRHTSGSFIKHGDYYDLQAIANNARKWVIFLHAVA